ncbi:hypothetical protein BHM03_00008405 [Ensete ventricosum]|nr:hypothetical protein BHM03_00008405 [Ensete ventricosum]
MVSFFGPLAGIVGDLTDCLSVGLRDKQMPLATTWPFSTACKHRSPTEARRRVRLLVCFAAFGPVCLCLNLILVRISPSLSEDEGKKKRRAR